MKKPIILVACLAILAVMSSCEKEQFAIKASEQRTEVAYTVGAFDELELSNEFIAEVRFSATEESVIIEANDNLQELIRVERQGNVLKIGMKDNTSIRGNTSLKAYIVTREITRFKGTGESQFIMHNQLNADQVRIDLTGESHFQGNVAVNRLDLNATGSSTTALSGTAQSVEANLTAESTMLNFDFSCRHLSAELAAESVARLQVEETIEISAAGESTLFYKGDAVITDQNLAGDSRVKKVN